MKKLFVDTIPGNSFTLSREQSVHIAKALRMRRGDMLTVSCGDGHNYGCIIDDIADGEVTLSVCYKQADNSEPSVRVTVYQGFPKGDKMEDIIQKCTELGVAAVNPVLTHRSVSRPGESAAKKKTERYRKIALESAQQSGRGAVPIIGDLKPLADAVKADDSELKILFYEGGGLPLRRLIKEGVKTVSIYIGPEGGFEKSEVDMITAAGAVAATLGSRILRTQTAPVAALSAIMLLTGNLE